MLDLLDIALGLVVGLSPTVVRFLKRFHRKKVAKGFFGGVSSNEFIIVYRAERDPSSKGRNHLLIKSQTVRAVKLIENQLKDLGYKVVDKPSTDQFSEEEKRVNVVIVGSSRTNDVVSQFPGIEKVYSFGFDEERDEYFILDNRNNTRHVSHLTRDDVADLALIVKMPNPHYRQNAVFYIAGVHADGTFAAAEFLTNTRMTREHIKPANLARQEGLVGIVQVTFAPGAIASPTSYDVISFEIVSYNSMIKFFSVDFLDFL